MQQPTSGCPELNWVKCKSPPTQKNIVHTIKCTISARIDVDRRYMPCDIWIDCVFRDENVSQSHFLKFAAKSICNVIILVF